MKKSEKQEIIEFAVDYIESCKKTASELRESEYTDLAKFFEGSARGMSTMLDFIKEKY